MHNGSKRSAHVEDPEDLDDAAEAWLMSQIGQEADKDADQDALEEELTAGGFFSADDNTFYPPDDDVDDADVGLSGEALEKMTNSVPAAPDISALLKAEPVRGKLSSSAAPFVPGGAAAKPTPVASVPRCPPPPTTSCVVRPADAELTTARTLSTLPLTLTFKQKQKGGKTFGQGVSGTSPALRPAIFFAGAVSWIEQELSSGEQDAVRTYSLPPHFTEAMPAALRVLRYLCPVLANVSGRTCKSRVAGDLRALQSLSETDAVRDEPNPPVSIAAGLAALSKAGAVAVCSHPSVASASPDQITERVVSVLYVVFQAAAFPRYVASYCTGCLSFLAAATAGNHISGEKVLSCGVPHVVSVMISVLEAAKRFATAADQSAVTPAPIEIATAVLFGPEVPTELTGVAKVLLVDLLMAYHQEALLECFVESLVAASVRAKLATPSAWKTLVNAGDFGSSAGHALFRNAVLKSAA